MSEDLRNPEETIESGMDEFWEEEFREKETLEEEAGAGTSDGGGDPESTEEEPGTTEEETTENPTAETSENEEIQRRMEEYGRQCVDQFIQRQFGNHLNPFTGQPIRTAADYEMYRQQYEEKRLLDALEGTEIPQEVKEGILRDRRMAMQSQEMIRRQEKQDRDDFTRAQLEKLNRAFPESNIKSLSELADTANGRRAIDLWTKGVSLDDAYAVAFQREISQNRSKAAKQQALNEANSKGHIAQPKGGESNEEMMDAEGLKEWKMFYPHLSEKQIMEKWKKNR